MVGIVFSLIATLGFGSSMVMTRLGLSHMRPVPGAWITLVAGSVATLSLALFVSFDEILATTKEALLWIAVIGFLNFCLGRMLNITSVKHIGATRASPIFALSPVFASFFAVSLLNEQITPLLLGGTVLIVAGVILITGERET